MITEPKVKKRRSIAQRRATKGAFTRIDLVALVATCCVVIPLFTHASAKSEEDIRRTVCRNNLREIGTWLTLYAKDNNDDLPQQVGLPSDGWAWDTSLRLIDAATDYGVNVDSFYCPSGPIEFAERGEAIGSYPGFGTTQYVLALKGAPALVATNTNEKIYPLPIEFRNTSYLPQAAERELAADVVMSTSQRAQTSMFSQIYGGSPIPHRTSHLSGQVPNGGNILFLDGSTNWRDFNDGMQPRTARAPYFWW